MHGMQTSDNKALLITESDTLIPKYHALNIANHLGLYRHCFLQSKRTSLPPWYFMLANCSFSSPYPYGAAVERTSRQLQENRRMKAAVDAIVRFSNCNSEE